MEKAAFDLNQNELYEAIWDPHYAQEAKFWE